MLRTQAVRFVSSFSKVYP